MSLSDYTTATHRDDNYESIYEVIRHPADDDEDSESDFDEVDEEDGEGGATTKQQRRRRQHPGAAAANLPIPGQLTKFAEAAGKRMRKLKRTWSLKKSDISRNLRKYSAPGFATKRLNPEASVAMRGAGSGKRHPSSQGEFWDDNNG